MSEARRVFGPRLVCLVTSVLITVAPHIVLAQVRPGQGPSMEQAQTERYDGPKARIAVADFEDKMSSSGQYRAEYGRGMADMLATALFNTNRYIVLERQKLTYVLAEQDLGASGRVKRETAAPIGELEGAELLVTAAVTGFDPGVAGGGGNASGVLGNLFGKAAGQTLGNIAGGFRRAHIALDLRVIDTKTGRVVAANSVQGSATEFSGTGGIANTTFDGALGGFAKTPMERAIREAIQASVDFVVSKTPAKYLRVAAATPSQPPVPELQSGPPTQAPHPAMASPGQMAPAGQIPFSPAAPPQMASLPPATAPPSPRVIAVDRNPRLMAELTEARQRGAVVSVTLTVRNQSESRQPLELTGKETYLLDYAEGKKYELIGFQGQRKLELGPNEHTVLRATFRAPQSAGAVAVVIDEIGTFDDVQVAR
jgi:curli biogenesis system outer membrane secretion channel CsgG